MSLQIKTVGLAKLTMMGMFWLNPKLYLACDANNRKLFKEMGIEREVKDLSGYLQLVSEVNGKLGTDYPQISRTAWEQAASEDGPTGGKQYWAGGFQWGDDRKLDEFMRGNFWQIGWKKTRTEPAAKKTWAYFEQVNVGDEFAIKGYGGRNDLRTYYIGKVLNKDNKGILSLEKLDLASRTEEKSQRV